MSIHAAYTCRHSGACCTAGWPIHLEASKVAVLRSRGVLDAARWLAATGDNPSAVIPRTAGGACVFFDAAHGRLCAIQRDAGASLMPAACRNFPRVALRDRRGLFVTLSHFCPTAARLLLSGGPIEIVDAPASITLDGDVEGLDARDVMPPLLRRDMLMDWDGYSAWEREGIAVLNDSHWSARVALMIITEATRDAAGWQPGQASLAARISSAFDRARVTHRRDQRPSAAPLQRALKAFLASHLFANWAAYQGGLGAALDSVDRAYSLAGDGHTDQESFIEAVRQADLRLRHTA